MYHVKHVENCKPAGQFNNSNDCNAKRLETEININIWMEINCLKKKEKNRYFMLEQSTIGRH